MKVVIIDKNQDYINRLKVSLESVSENEVQVYDCSEDFANIDEIIKFEPDIILKGKDIFVDNNVLKCPIVIIEEDEKNIQQNAVFKWQSTKNIYDKLVEINKQAELERRRKEEEERQRQAELERQRKEEAERQRREALELQKKVALEQQKIQMANMQANHVESKYPLRGKVVAFMGAVSKSGNSLAALGLAKKWADVGKKVLYFNWNEFNSHAYFQQVNARADLKDVIISVKKREGNINNIISNSLCMDRSHICYFHNLAQWDTECRITGIDMAELLQVIDARREFDLIVIDTRCETDDLAQTICKYSNYVVFTTNGNPIANQGFQEKYQNLANSVNAEKINLKNKVAILYTAFSNQESKMLNNPPAIVMGGIPMYENKKIDEIILNISNMTIFDTIR